MASILPKGKTQYTTLLGRPLAAGKVYFYLPGTETKQDTWQDAAMTIPNTNPVVLDARGEAVIWGEGTYRQVVKQVIGPLEITVWDEITTSSVSDAALAGPGGAAMIGFDGTTLDQQLKTRVSRTCDSLAELRSISGSIYSRAQTVGALKPGDGGQNNFWANYDDTTSADNGVTLIVGSDGTRWHAENMRVVDTRQAGLNADGETDDYAAIQRALSCGAVAVRHVVNSAISSYLTVPAGVRFFTKGEGGKLTALNDMPAYTPWGSAGSQGQMAFLDGDGAQLDGIWTFGNGFKAGGVATYTYSRNRVDNLLSTSTGASQGLLATNSSRLRVTNPSVYQCNNSAIELWQTANTTVENPIVDLVTAGGVFMTNCTMTVVNGGAISNCGDVGADIEGGIGCSFNGTSVTACCNGEAAWFAGDVVAGLVPANCSFNGLTCTRAATYLAYSAANPSGVSTACNASAGGITVDSIQPGQQAITFTGNTVYAAAGMTALYTNDLGANPCGISIIGNHLYSAGSLHTIQRAYGIVVKGNNFHGYGASNAAENIFKNCDSGVFDSNTYEYEQTKNGNYALKYYTDVAITTGPTISNNIFKNCGIWAFTHDPFNSGVPAYLSGNLFSETAVTNGGVNCTANGIPVYRNQLLTFLINENLTGSGPCTVNQYLPGLTALQGAITFGAGTLAVEDGFLGNMYTVAYSGGAEIVKSYDGSGSGTGLNGSTSRFVEFDGGTVTITGPDNGVSGVLQLTLNTST